MSIISAPYIAPLPAPLPEGERLLWQGKPQTAPFLKRIFYTRAVVCYVGLLLGWCLVSGAQAGNLGGASLSALRFAALAGGALAVLAVLAWIMGRSTTYSITSQRVLIEYGAAMEKTVQIPFAVIEAAGLMSQPDGTGDLMLSLLPGNKVNYLMMWPHVRPWHITRPEPTLRAVADSQAVAQILSRALAASAGTAPVALLDNIISARPASVAAAA